MTSISLADGAEVELGVLELGKQFLHSIARRCTELLM
jgi:hypothetical protein